MRVFARRERPHPGTQLTLFEAEDGWRYSLWVTNLPERTPGWRGQSAYIDPAHRIHARVEDLDPHRQRHRHRQAPLNQAWLAAALIAATLLAWLRLLTLDGSPRPSPRPCATASSTPPPGPGHQRS